MDSKEALEKAREHLRDWIDVRPCKSPQGNLYGFDPDKDYLFEIVYGPALNRIGSTEYLAVSRETGAVRHFSQGD